jgi:hypothetical protein
MNRLDHLVIGAETLRQGVDYIRSVLDVELPKGGLHKTMGTHNHLMQLGNDSYIEVIAINPEAAAPRQPRWFNLDDGLMRASLQRQPRLITWVINTTDIKAVELDSKLPIGVPTELSRDSLSWQLGLTEDGRLLANGLVPYVLQWHTEQHPSRSMAELGCRLHSLEIYHNRPDWLHSILASMSADHLVSIHPLADTETPYLSANIETPSGLVNLNSKMD